MASNRSVRCAQEHVTYTCALCDSPDNVNWYCNDCQEALCDRCKETHTRGKKSRNDDIVAIGKANRQGDKPVPEVCKLHPGKLCDLYCSDCNELLCGMCVSKSHKLHNWKPIEEEFPTKKQQLKRHITTISSKIQHVKNETSKRHRANEAFKQNIDTMRKEVDSQRTKLKAEVDSLVDAALVELSSLEQEESGAHTNFCLQSQEKVVELTRLLEKAEKSYKTNEALFETEKSLYTTLPLYDVYASDNLPKSPNFVTGSIDRVVLTKMVGELFPDIQAAEIDIDIEHVQRLSMFTVTEQKEILSICPVDNNHAWLTMNQYKGLVMVNREGVVTNTVKLGFCPYRTTLIGTTNILLTSYDESSFVYKLTLRNKQVTTFADIRPHKACDISINEMDEVFVGTGTLDIVVLDKSGKALTKLSCEMKAWSIASLSSGDMAVIDVNNVLVIIDSSGKTKFEWTGELDNGQKVDDADLYQVSRDKYDRVFVPDSLHNQVYVLSRDGKQAVCLLDKKYRVTNPLAVGVDTCGHVWIGGANGIVHVMQL
ncbi:Transcription intermediary factor 1-alpha [Mizuhopecten yessoensis]|uniref:Transcription intermediary factor 1-alpha n=1 Tax=Mizuhopecten yessoensis TaxID=6573 RepID=A0A210QC68_MIZYE|nr:Transcription intermediary factor 1-alpha [Mizuhopecten yessoensis]